MKPRREVYETCTGAAGKTQSAALGADSDKPARPGEVTFAREVAPILQRPCQNCHRPSSIAPMSLLTYREARPWARSIKETLVRRQMPPSHIDRNVSITKFKDDPSFTDAEIATITNWVDQGAPQGNPADMPPRQFSLKTTCGKERQKL